MTPETLEAIRERDKFYMQLSLEGVNKYFPTGKAIVAAEDRHDLLEYIDELHRRLESETDKNLHDV